MTCNKKEVFVTLTVAECGEFHSIGEFHEGIKTVPEAIRIFNGISPERMNGIPSIGINIHTQGTEAYEDVAMDIVSGKVIDVEMLEYVPEITGNPVAMSLIKELIASLPGMEVRGDISSY